MKTKQEHIAMIEFNLADAQSRLHAGKITPKHFNILRKDAKRRLAEIRSEPSNLWK